MTSRFTGFAKTQAEIGGLLGISSRTFREWQSSGLQCWHAGRGYSLEAAIRWAKQHRWQPRQAGDEDDDRRSVAEVRKLEAEAKIREVKAQQLMGALVDRDAVDGAIGSLLDSIRNRLSTVAGEVAGVAPERFRRDVAFSLANRIRLIQTEISAWQADRREIKKGGGATDAENGERAEGELAEP